MVVNVCERYGTCYPRKVFVQQLVHANSCKQNKCPTLCGGRPSQWANNAHRFIMSRRYKRRTCVITRKNVICKTSPYTKYCKITLRRCLVNLEDTLLVVGDEHFYSPNILGKDAKGSYFCIHSYFLYLLLQNIYTTLDFCETTWYWC